MLFNILFFIFLSQIISLGFLVIFSNNAVWSVLSLIVIFLLCSFLFIFLGAEFLGILLLIVYVGAISILFLFVVMMLNLRVIETNDFFNHLPAGSFISFMFIFLIFTFLDIHLGFFSFDFFFSNRFFFIWVDMLFYLTNVFHFANVLYNFFPIFIIMASIILLVSMVGVIILTLDFEYRKVGQGSLKEQFIITDKGLSLNFSWKTKITK